MEGAGPRLRRAVARLQGPCREIPPAPRSLLRWRKEHSRKAGLCPQRRKPFSLPPRCPNPQNSHPPQTQYGNILRVRPDDQKSPLLQPANEHKQLVVIDFEYAAANLPGLEFANHFSEWTYNYHDPVRPHACNTSQYPTPEEQRRFVKAYVDHRPQLPPPTPAGGYTESPAQTPQTPPVSSGAAAANGPSSSSSSTSFFPPSGPGSGLHATPSSSSIVEFMLDARVPPGGWKEEERKREEEAEGKIRALLEETRLWRTANSAQWVAWGIVQAKIPGLDVGVNGVAAAAGDADGDGDANGAGGEEGDGGEAKEKEEEKEEKEEKEEEKEEEFDYLAYAQERAYFFLGDCVVMGLIKAEELGEELRERIKVVEY